MSFNVYVWSNYKESKNGQHIIQTFEEGSVQDMLGLFGENNDQTPAFKLVLEVDTVVDDVEDLQDFCVKPVLPETLTFEESQDLFELIVEEGFTLKDSNGPTNIIDVKELLYAIPSLSIWLYQNYPTIFKPYLFRHNFALLIRIADTFGLDLPSVPLKRYVPERIFYYSDLCMAFAAFEEQHNLSPAEMCAFLYDFAPRYVQTFDSLTVPLPSPTQVWMIGANKTGGDFDFLDNATSESTHFWQGNEEVRRGDILIMYCLSPRSLIHSIWRAVTDGVSDPFANYYGSVYVGKGERVSSISLHDLQNDSYFKIHPLVRKNLQGLNNKPLSAEDYQRLLQLIIKKGGRIDELPQLLGRVNRRSNKINSERDVELHLIEPLLGRLGYTSQDWVRQLLVRTGRIDRNYPDYAFLTDRTLYYEQAWMLIESKWNISSNRDLEEAFRQVWSYGQRLGARTLVIADKESIWVYEKQKNVFDRTVYENFHWEQLEHTSGFNQLRRLIGKG